MTTERYHRAIDLVVAAYSRDGKRDIWNAVSFVQKELAALGAELDPALRSRIEKHIADAIENIIDTYTGEARTDLVQAMDAILEARG